eukprot:1159658-Pelagomonas_calceolata.AAC.1
MQAGNVAHVRGVQLMPAAVAAAESDLAMFCQQQEEQRQLQTQAASSVQCLGSCMPSSEVRCWRDVCHEPKDISEEAGEWMSGLDMIDFALGLKVQGLKDDWNRKKLSTQFKLARQAVLEQ